MTADPVQPIKTFHRVVCCVKAPEKRVLVEGTVQPISEKVLDQNKQHDLNRAREFVGPQRMSIGLKHLNKRNQK